MKNVAIIVVTFNRKELLVKNIQALKKQTYQNFDFYIIDNASTDNTYDAIQKYVDNENIFYKNTKKNLGGAGGFNFGLKWVLKKDYKYVWLMDDDTIPEDNALEELINASNILEDDFGFLSSIVLWKNGALCEMNKQKIQKPWYTKGQYLQYGLLKTYYATFVSFFIKSSTVKEIGYPIKDFFIWGDDIEYTNRISKQYVNYIVGKSKVLHEIKNNEGSNIAKDDLTRLSRYKYAYRNEVYIAKTNGFVGLVRQFAKILFHMYRVIRYSKKNKFKKINIILTSSIKGIFFDPKIEYFHEGV